MADCAQEEGSPGRDAIAAALEALYPDQAPRHYGPPAGRLRGGREPLDGISAYWRQTPVPHWHFVTYGFSELHAKQSGDPACSGSGFELTFRLAAEHSDEPPGWVFDFLQNLARGVFESGNGFAVGHYLNTNGPIARESDTVIRSIAFRTDPELWAGCDTPNGRLDFLQVVGLTEDEELAAKRWNMISMLDVFAACMPLWITDLGRGSLLADLQIASAVEAGARQDGSCTSFLHVDALGWKEVAQGMRPCTCELTIGARQIGELRALLPGRLPFGRPFLLRGDEVEVVFLPAERDSVAIEGGVPTVRLTPDTVDELCRVLEPRSGRYALAGLPNLFIVVEPTPIRASDGSIVRVIG